MHGLELPAAIAGALIICVVLWDTFETMVLPRSGMFGLRLTRWYYQGMWGMYRLLTRPLKSDNPFRHALLGSFGPLSLVFLIVFWASLLVVGFGLLMWGIGEPIAVMQGMHAGNIADYLYMSGTTLFTLGYGDRTPGAAITRTLCITESGVGFGLLATVIGYLPTLYQTFARREAMVLRLYVRAGTPPTVARIVQPYADAGAWSALEGMFRDWEVWGAELLESYRSYPVLAFYRSQRESQSWLAAAVTMRETCAHVKEYCPVGSVERASLLLQAEITGTVLHDALNELAVLLRLCGDHSPEALLADRLLLDLQEVAPSGSGEGRQAGKSHASTVQAITP